MFDSSPAKDDPDYSSAKETNKPSKTRKFTIGGTSLTLQDVEIADNIGKCRKCDFDSTEAPTVENHVNRVHKKVTPYECDMCDKQFFAKKNLSRHVERHGKKLPRGNTGKKKKPVEKKKADAGNSISNFSYRLSKTLKKLTYFLCLLSVKSKWSGLTIKRDEDYTVLPSREKKCILCELTAKDISTIEKHVNEVHKNIFPYICEHCGLTFSAKKKMEKHIAKVHLGRVREISEDSRQRVREWQSERVLCNCCGKMLVKSAVKEHKRKAVSKV